MMNQNEFLSDQAAEKISKMATGTVVHHEVLMNMLQCATKNGAYRLRIQKTREKLIVSYHRFLKTIPKVGYEIAQPGQEVALVSSEFLQGISRTGRSAVKSSYIDITAIPRQEQARTITEVQRMSTIMGLVAGSLPTGVVMKAEEIFNKRQV